MESAVRVFSDGFYQKIIGCPDRRLFEEAIIADRNRTKKEMNRIEISFGPQAYYLALRGFTIRRPKERKSLSRESNALYLAQSEESRYGLLFQYLPPHSTTSRHHHTARTEIFHSFEGTALLHMPEKTVCLKPNHGYVVGPNIWHQLETKGSPALTVLKIIGIGDNSAVFGADDHIYQ